MTARVGGVTISLGLDGTKFTRGLELSKTQLAQFQRAMTSIRLEGAIKGDPFSATDKYLKRAKKELNNVFSSFSEYARYTTFDFNKFAEAARESASSVVKSWTIAEKKLKDATVKTNTILEKKIDLWKLYKDISKSDPQAAQQEYDRAFGREQAYIASGGKSTGALKALGVPIKRAQAELDRIEEFKTKTKELIVNFKGLSVGLDSEINNMVKRINAGEKISTQSMSNLIKKLANTVTLKKPALLKEIDLLVKETARSLRVGFARQKGFEFGSAITEAGSDRNAIKRRADQIRTLRIENAKLNAEIRIGMNVEQNRIAKLQNSIKMLNLYGRDTKKATAELARLRMEQQKLTKVKDTGFLSKQWFISRAGWFIQLRGFWALYRGLGNLARSLTDKETQLARAMRTSNSEFMSRTTLLRTYSIAMSKAIVTHATDWKAPAEVLYQLTSAGLSSEEALSGLNSTLSLIVGTEGEAMEVTKGIAGIYNNFKDSITNVTSESEKLNYINDLVAVTWKNHQVEIGELIQGYKQSSAMAKVAGVSIEELTALLALANDHMIKAGTAGRSLQNVFMRIARTPRQFSEAFQIDIDVSKPLKLVDIMEKLHKKFEVGAISVGQLSDIFERMGIRGAPAFATLLTHWDEYGKIMIEQKALSGETAKIEADRLDNLSSKWKIFSNAIIATISELGVVKNAIQAIKDTLSFWGNIFKDTSQLRSDLNAGRDLVEDLHYRKTKLEIISPAQVETLQKFLNAMTKYREEHTFTKKDLFTGKTKLISTLTKEDIKYIDEYTAKAKDLIKIAQDSRVAALMDPAIPDVTITDEAAALSRAERMYWLKHKEGTEAEKILYLNSEIERVAIEIAKLEEDAKDPKQDFSSRKMIFEKHLAALQEEKKTAEDMIGGINKELQDAFKEDSRLRKHVADQEKDSSDRRIRMLELEKKGLEFKIQGYKIETLTEDEKDKALAALESQLKIEQDITREKYIQSKKGVEIGSGEEEEIYRQEMLTAQLDYEKKVAAITEARRKSKKEEDKKALREQIALNDEQVLIAERALIDAELINVPLAERLKLEKNILDVRLKGELLSAELLKDTKVEYLRYLNKIRKTMGELQKSQEAITREANIWYDLYRKIEEKAGSVRDLHRSIVDLGTDMVSSGTTDIVYDVTGGFQEQRQEVINLEAELKELAEAHRNAIAEGDIGRAKQLNSEMSELNEQIRELEDPIEQTKDAFRDLFKDVIDGIRKAIIEWLIMQTVMRITKAAAGGSAGEGWRGDLGGEGFVPAAKGGILPSIKSFQRFSSGGITGGPTMAILGDNKSGKELVIPTENIQSDQVSGYMRDSQPVYIANFITQADLIAGMASAEGGKVVVNHVLRSKSENGRAWQTA